METQLSVKAGTSLFSASQTLQRCQLCRTIPSCRPQTGQRGAGRGRGVGKGVGTHSSSSSNRAAEGKSPFSQVPPS